LLFDHDSQRLDRAGAADRLLDQIRGEMDNAGAASAGEAVAVDDEHLIRNHPAIGEFGGELFAVEPAHASEMPFEEPGTGQHEGACAESDQLDPARGGLAKKRVQGPGNLLATVKQAADDDQV